MQALTTGRFLEPTSVTSHFHLRAGDRVADFGAGTGYFMKALSRAIGPEGRVYALEIQKALVDSLGNLAIKEHLSNVEPIWCDLESLGGTKLADAVLDAGVLVNTFFQIEDKKTSLEEMARTLRKGGKFFVVDWTESFAGLGPHPNQVVDEMTAKSLVESAGFTFERSFPTGDHHYGLAFRRI
jgi:ubiquinone/menaquinone biosynthesis C-methylase UbiE